VSRDATVDESQILAALAGVPLFAGLGKRELRKVAGTATVAHVPAGQHVVREGFTAEAFYVILEGEARVVVGDQMLHTLGRGDFFGEIAALTGETPSADVVAQTMLRCLVIPPQDLERLLLERPQMMLRLLRMEARRLRTSGQWQT